MNNIVYKRKCPKCNTEICTGKLGYYYGLQRNSLCMSCSKKGCNNPIFGKHHTENTKTKMGVSKMGNRNPLFGKLVYDRTGCSMSSETKQQMSLSQTIRYSNYNEIEKTSRAVTTAMHRPDVRKKHIEGLFNSKWIKVKTDKGQLELLEKWNKLGFHFEPNYQVHTDTDLFYIDGYDKEREIVLEYDSKYHSKREQIEKDLIRQNRIINILTPKKFWRYDAVNKQCKNVLEKVG
jgi:hypothetical protein